MFHKKNGPLFLFFIIHSNVSQFTQKFLQVVAQEIQIQNISTKYGSWLNILCWSSCNADVIMCRKNKLACLNWCDRFAHFFFGCNCKTSRICHQQTRL